MKQREAKKYQRQQIQGTELHEKFKVKQREAKKYQRQQIKGTELHEKRKETKRESMEYYRKKIKETESHSERKKKDREAKKQKHENMTGVERIEMFKKLIREGPLYVCVCCNRCLYRQSVIFFSEDRYSNIYHILQSDIVKSFDNQIYICLTCHKKMLKKEIPCQSVSNKLELYSFPTELNDIRKLERILISQRILFSKVIIMHKGEFPKLKGAICNVPIETPNVCNVLPRGSDNNGIINVELKRKLSYKCPIISQQVRREKIQSLLSFLKNHNHLYKDIEIQFLDEESVSQIDFNVDKLRSSCHHPDHIEIKFVNDDSVDIIQTFHKQTVNEFESEDPLNMFRMPANETLLVSEIPNVN